MTTNNGYTALHKAVESFTTHDAIKLLIEIINSQKDRKLCVNSIYVIGTTTRVITVLYRALERGHTDIAKYLLSLKDERGLSLCDV